jgi:hypothetical protein
VNQKLETLPLEDLKQWAKELKAQLESQRKAYWDAEKKAHDPKFSYKEQNEANKLAKDMICVSSNTRDQLFQVLQAIRRREPEFNLEW